MGKTALLPFRRKVCLGLFSPWKIRQLRSGLNPRTWVPKASTLPLDHRSRFIRLYQNHNSWIAVTHKCTSSCLFRRRDFCVVNIPVYALMMIFLSLFCASQHPSCSKWSILLAKKCNNSAAVVCIECTTLVCRLMYVIYNTVRLKLILFLCKL